MGIHTINVRDEALVLQFCEKQLTLTSFSLFSISKSFFDSEFFKRDTGIPVCLATQVAMASLVKYSASILCDLLFLIPSALSISFSISSSCLSSLGISPGQIKNEE